MKAESKRIDAVVSLIFKKDFFFFLRKIKVDNFDFKQKCEQVAAKLDGFSGREISKLMVSCQAATFASDSGIFDEKMFDQKVDLALISHKKKMEWRSEHEKN